MARAYRFSGATRSRSATSKSASAATNGRSSGMIGAGRGFARALPAAESAAFAGWRAGDALTLGLSHAANAGARDLGLPIADPWRRL